MLGCVTIFMGPRSLYVTTSPGWRTGTSVSHLLLLSPRQAAAGRIRKQRRHPRRCQSKCRRPRPQKVNDTTEYVATLKSRDSAVIMPQVEGQITKIFVHSGDRVNAGTPLMQIDPAKQQATVKSQQDTQAAAVANLKYAQQQYERAKQSLRRRRGQQAGI